jgi:hypothetical protein
MERLVEKNYAKGWLRVDNFAQEQKQTEVGHFYPCASNHEHIFCPFEDLI